MALAGQTGPVPTPLCEKRLITKEHIQYVVIHKHLNLVFKQALHLSTLAIKVFNSGTKLFNTIINNVTL